MTVTKVTRSHNRGRASVTNFTSETLLNRGNVENVQMGVADGALGLILDMLTDISANCGAYAVRETYSNAQDAIRGMKNGRIDITLSTKDDASGVVARILKNKSYDDTFGCFTISDNGIGMSADDVCNLFLQYGGSNKRDNADSIGSKGLGSKAPLAITDNFMVITVKNGVETVVNIHRDGDNNSADIQSSSTDKPNGTSVIVPIMSYETYTQIDCCINLLKNNNYDTNLFVNGEPVKKIIDDNDYISSVIKINDTDSVQVVVSATELLKRVNCRWDMLDDILSVVQQFTFDAVIGGYPYNLSKSRSIYSDIYVRVLMKPGFFDFTPSRDEIMDNSAFSDFMSVFMDEWDKGINGLVNKAVHRVAYDYSRSLSDRVSLIAANATCVPDVTLNDDVFDNQYKLTSMLMNTCSVNDMSLDDADYKKLMSKRDTTIPRYFMMKRDGRDYVASIDAPVNSVIRGNMSYIVSHITDNIREYNGSGLDNLFYVAKTHKNIVVYGGKTDAYLKTVSKFGNLTRAMKEHLSNDWGNARYIFLMDTDKITDDIRDIINLTGTKVNSYQGYYGTTIETKYYTFDEITTIIEDYRAANKAARNSTQPKDLNVVMYDINDKDNNDNLDWTNGHIINNIQDIKDGLIVFANSSRATTTNTYSNSIRQVLSMNNINTTKGYLVIDAKANTVRTIMKNKNLHVLADTRTRVNKDKRYTSDYEGFFLTKYGYLRVTLDYAIPNSPVFQKEYNALTQIRSYRGMNAFNALVKHFTNKTNPTDIDNTIIKILNDMKNVFDIIAANSKYYIDTTNCNNVTVPDTEYNYLATKLINLIQWSEIESITNLANHTDDDITKDILTNALIEIVSNKLNKSITEYREQHDQTTN